MKHKTPAEKYNWEQFIKVEKWRQKQKEFHEDLVESLTISPDPSVGERKE